MLSEAVSLPTVSRALQKGSQDSNCQEGLCDRGRTCYERYLDIPISQMPTCRTNPSQSQGNVANYIHKTSWLGRSERTVHIGPGDVHTFMADVGSQYRTEGHAVLDSPCSVNRRLRQQGYKRHPHGDQEGPTHGPMSDPVTKLLELSGPLPSLFRIFTASVGGLVGPPGLLAGTAFTLVVLANVSP